jgi:hypothetical protein
LDRRSVRRREITDLSDLIEEAAMMNQKTVMGAVALLYALALIEIFILGW